MVIKVYTSRACGNSRMKKEQEYITRMLYIQNIEYEEIDVGDPRRMKDRRFMQKKLNLNDLDLTALPPQIFNDEHPVGEFDDFFSAVECNNTFGFLKLPDDYVNNNPPNGEWQPFRFSKEEAEEILRFRKLAMRQKKKKRGLKALPEEAQLEESATTKKEMGFIHNTPAFQAMSRKLSMSNESITSLGKLQKTPSRESISSIGKLKISPSIESLGKIISNGNKIEAMPTKSDMDKSTEDVELKVNESKSSGNNQVDTSSTEKTETLPTSFETDRTTKEVESKEEETKPIDELTGNCQMSTMSKEDQIIHDDLEASQEVPPAGIQLHLDSEQLEISPPVEIVEESVAENWTVVEEPSVHLGETSKDPPQVKEAPKQSSEICETPPQGLVIEVGDEITGLAQQESQHNPDSHTTPEYVE